MNTTTKPPAHEQTSEPAYLALEDFICNCSNDPETRESMTSALVLDLWQLGARGNKNQLPSTVLVPTANKDTDFILNALHQLSNYHREIQHPIPPTINYGPNPADYASFKMQSAVQALDQYQAEFAPVTELEKDYHEARIIGYGTGDVAPYVRGWDRALGLVTDQRNAIHLHLHEQEDWNAFRRDLENEPGKLNAPTGIGQQLQVVDKAMSFTGTLPADQLDYELVDSMLNLGLPIFFQPHSCTEPLRGLDNKYLTHFVGRMRAIPDLLICNFTQLPEDKLVGYYQNWIWQRLSKLPARYRFGVMETVHQLQGVCEQLAIFSHPSPYQYNGSSKIKALARNLFTCVLRSIALSLAFLAWHGLGIEPGCSVRTTRKVLKLLREDGGSVSRRDVQRFVGFSTATKRDQVLEELENQGLVTLDDNLVSATTMPEFIQNIQEQLPMATKA